MKDKDDNLEEFLRNKFAEDNTSSDGWDVPNQDVWKQAQLNIPDYPIKEKKDRKGIIIILLLLLIGSYISWSLLKINALEKELDVQKIQFAEIEKNDNISNNTYVLENKKLIQKNDDLIATNHSLEREVNSYNSINEDVRILKNNQRDPIKKIGSLIEINKILQDKIASQLINISSLKKQNNILQKERSNKDIIYAKNTTINSTVPNKEDRLNLNIPTISPYKWINQDIQNEQLSINQIIIPKAAKNKQFEVGYSYALSSINAGYKKDFKNFEIESDGYKKDKTLIHFNGVDFGFSPKGNNWFIQAGFHTASTKIKQHSTSSIIYDESNEYNNTEGEKVNDIEVNARTLFGENKSLVSIKIPDNANIETGDILYFDSQENQQQKQYKIPLGVAYFHGKNKLKWLAKGGVEWNKITSNNYEITADVYSSNGIFPIDKIEISNKRSSSSQFMGTYAGIGADYQISPRWHTRAELVYHYNFINNKSIKSSTSDLITRDFKLGVSYRF
jgi:hypothetical protein